MLGSRPKQSAPSDPFAPGSRTNAAAYSMPSYVSSFSSRGGLYGTRPEVKGRRS